MSRKAPGKSGCQGVSLFELQRMFPHEEAARKWFEGIVWPDGNRACPRCESNNTHECSHAKMPYRCRDCRKYFSVKTGTVMQGSPLSLLKWVYAIYRDSTSLKGVSSMKLHRELGVTQKSAWYMQQRIREAYANHIPRVPMSGPVEVDETYFGGKRKNMSNAKRRGLEDAGRGPAGKTPVVGAKDRETNQFQANVVASTDAETLQGFVSVHADATAKVYTDDRRASTGIPNVQQGIHECVHGQAHTKRIESFWSMLKRAHTGAFHKISPKHLNRYVQGFSSRHNVRELGTVEQMSRLASRMVGQWLPYRSLMADNGLCSGARDLAA